MQLYTRMLGSFLIGTWVFATIAGAGAAGGKPEKPDKEVSPKAGRLGVPSNVVCAKVGDQLTLSWDAVPEAMQYRVNLEASDESELVDTVPAPQTTYTHPMSDMTDDPDAEIKGHVRAMRSKMGKGMSKKSDHVPCK